MSFKKLGTFAFFLFIVITVAAQDTHLVQFAFNKKNKGDGNFVLSIKAKPTAGVKLLSVQKISEELPINTTITFDSSIQKFLVDSIVESGKVNTEFDSSLNTSLHFLADSVEWQQKLLLKPGDSIRIKGIINYYYKKDGAIQSGEEKISQQFQYTRQLVENTGKSAQSFSLIGLLIAGLLAGLIAFLSPCVYALVPVTVSLFIKRSKTPTLGKKNAFFYAFCILAIYTIIGILTGPVLPRNAFNNLSTNWIFNLVIFAMFIVFGVSFLGAFDINLPASWSNKLDRKSNSNSYIGIFFMALTLVVVSFSCTGNFVASLLGVSAGSRLGPAVGMFGFGLGLALPFAIFAFFPSLMKNLTKSGGWQNTLKVTLGFLELALALKFLSNADIARGWRLLDREIFIIIWVTIFIVLGIYLLGKIKFKHDSELPKNDFELPYLPISRLMLAMTSIAFAIYLIPGLWGAPLQGVSGFLPPIGTQDFILTKNKSANNEHANTANLAVSGLQPPQKHVKRLSLYEPLAAKENQLTIYYDYQEALAAAKILKKPLMLDFTGINCVNCREFESKIWVNEGVVSRMKNDFVVASLFCDYDDEELPDDEKYYSELLGTRVETVGDKNEDFQQQLIHASGQPNYVFVDNDGKLLVPEGYGYDATRGPQDFINHLEKVKSIFKKTN